MSASPITLDKDSRGEVGGTPAVYLLKLIA
jgi:hypothetical protein